ncbi:PREDICTED: nesprin-4 [Elephantulus edwardii]|uniref:nesprin-4 n=1 Tax=Elephantulus edwardii TaxID=28737 RepID=UPI0003F0C47A|nr:PREDICTED: nesprin-4 [Elephantulus edwardii]
MALPLPPDPRSQQEPLSYPHGAPRELDIVRCTINSSSEEETHRPEQAQELRPDSLDPLEHFCGGPRRTEPVTSTPRLPAPSSHQDLARGRHCEHLIFSREALEVEQDLCLFGLGLQLLDLDRSLGPWELAQSGLVPVQALQADLRRAAQCVDTLLAFSEVLAQRGELQAPAPLEQVLRVLRTHRDSIMRWLWQLQAKLVSYRLVFEEVNKLDQDLEAEGDSDGPGHGGVWGPWTPSGLSTPIELEWDPAGDVGELGPLGRKAAKAPGTPCELCGHKGPWGTGQDFEDMLMLGRSHRKHLAGYRRCSRIPKPQDMKRQASASPQDVMLEVDPRWSLTFLLLLLFLLMAATLLLPTSGGLCCTQSQLARSPYLVLNYINGPPPT